MLTRNRLWPLAVLVLGACAAERAYTSSNENTFIEQLPDPVLAIAAPYQNLQAVKLLPEDGCYWYLHAGPVEATYLPLRTTKGRPICTQKAEATE